MFCGLVKTFKAYVRRGTADGTKPVVPTDTENYTDK